MSHFDTLLIALLLVMPPTALAQAPAGKNGSFSGAKAQVVGAAPADVSDPSVAGSILGLQTGGMAMSPYFAGTSYANPSLAASAAAAAGKPTIFGDPQIAATNNNNTDQSKTDQQNQQIQQICSALAGGGLGNGLDFSNLDGVPRSGGGYPTSDNDTAFKNTEANGQCTLSVAMLPGACYQCGNGTPGNGTQRGKDPFNPSAKCKSQCENLTFDCAKHWVFARGQPIVVQHPGEADQFYLGCHKDTGKNDKGREQHKITSSECGKGQAGNLPTSAPELRSNPDICQGCVIHPWYKGANTKGCLGVEPRLYDWLYDNCEGCSYTIIREPEGDNGAHYSRPPGSTQ